MMVVLHQHGHGHSNAGGGNRREGEEGEHGQETTESTEQQQQQEGEERRERERIPRSGLQNKNINVHAAFIHVLGDLIQSIGIVIAGYIISFKVHILVCPWVWGVGVWAWVWVYVCMCTHMK